MFAADAVQARQGLAAVIEWVVIALNGASVTIIVFGGLATIVYFPNAIRGRVRFTQIRLNFARYLALALEFQLASDVLETALAPTWTRLGTLGAIAAIRTMLNYFLAREMADERTLVGSS